MKKISYIVRNKFGYYGKGKSIARRAGKESTARG